MALATAHRDRVTREALRRCLGKSAFDLLWHAGDQEELQRRLRQQVPRLLLVELQMLGAQAENLPALLQRGCAVIALAGGHAVDAAYEALGRGALGLIEPPGLGDDGELLGASRFLARVQLLAGLVGPAEASTPMPAPTTMSGGPVPPLLALGASTGGPLALAQVLASLPAQFDAAVVLVQHIESEYAAGLADWLGSHCALPVALAAAGATPRAGHVHVAGPGAHLVLQDSGKFAARLGVRSDLHVPSIDMLFKSLAEHAAPGVAAILTGMGHDGVAGLQQMRQRGWHTLAQDEASSVVYGMPREALLSGAAQESLPLPAIGPALVRALARRRHA